MSRGAEFKNIAVTVVGLGASGYAAARALVNLGARVHVTESGSNDVIQERAEALRSAGAAVETGGHRSEPSRPTELTVVSPGVPLRTPVIDELRRAGSRIISEVELAYRLSSCDFLAVTGTNGKTTTTSLLTAMLQEAGVKAIAAGNIGRPLVEAVASIPPDGTIVAEVSSFQLETIDSFRPRVAVLLNISHDHLDWHQTFDDYVAAKARIIANQQANDTFVFNADDPHARTIAESAPGKVVPFSARRAMPDGAGVVDGDRIEYRGRSVLSLQNLRLPGVPGLEDTAAALAAAIQYGVDDGAAARAARSFKPLHHRLELVAQANGVAYINDSKATNPHATLAAVEDLQDVVLIAGGRAKGIDLRPLAATVPPVRAVVALGEATAEIENVFAGKVPVQRAQSMTDAVRIAHAQSIPGGSVLLSPGCASLDMFENYEARGEAFARAVHELTEGED